MGEGIARANQPQLLAILEMTATPSQPLQRTAPCVTALAFAALLTCQFALAARGDITRDRAHQLAAYYFARYFNEGCGGAALPELHGEYWESTARIGYAGTPSGTIRVHRRTGTVSYDRPLSFKPTVSAESLDRWSKSLDERTHKP